MSEQKPFASLGPMLLARKGTAKPAMRVQLGTGDRTATLGDDFEELAVSQSALGWDDMGDGAQVLEMHVANDRAATNGRSRRHKTNQEAHRAAFTLRLDADRHLRLRLASTIQDCSAQSLVTEALDRFLEDMPELEAIATQVKRKKKEA